MEIHDGRVKKRISKIEWQSLGQGHNVPFPIHNITVVQVIQNMSCLSNSLDLQNRVIVVSIFSKLGQ